MDFSKCHCSSHGFCPIFNRQMGTDPPDWKWCQTTTEAHRKQYYDIVSECFSNKSENQKFIEILSEFDYNNEWSQAIYLSMIIGGRAPCPATQDQKNRLKKLIDFAEAQEQRTDSFDNVEILCLGHLQAQFDSIEDRPYLKKINLNTIDAGRFSDNSWAEGRAYIAAPSLFSDKTEWVGFTTASWNAKYKSYTRIDNFHNWNSAKLLINSKPEDRLVLCADVICSCYWIREKDNVLSAFFTSDRAADLGKSYLEKIGLRYDSHIMVPYANQLIWHRSNFERYRNFLVEREIYDQIKEFIDTKAKEACLKDESFVAKEYIFTRLYAYFTELTTCFWFLNNPEYLAIPNAERKEDWYYPQAVEERMNKWNMISS